MRYSRIITGFLGNLDMHLFFLLALSVGGGYLLGSIPCQPLITFFTVRLERIFPNLAQNVPVFSVLSGVIKGTAATLLGLAVSTLAPFAAHHLSVALIAGIGAVVAALWSPWAHFNSVCAPATAFGVALPLYPLGALLGLLFLALLHRFIREPITTAILSALSYPLLVHLSLTLTGSAMGPLGLYRGSSNIIAMLLAVQVIAPILRSRAEA